MKKAATLPNTNDAAIGVKLEIEHIHRNVHILTFCDTQEFLLISDIHFDNPKCDRKLLKKHLDEAKEKGTPIFINGDFFCLMQGKFDPRGKKKDVRPEYATGNYIDLVIDDACNFLTPYADLLAVIGYGNHENSIINRLETDPIQRLVDKLRDRTGSLIQAGGYGGWIILRFKLRGTSIRCYKIKYYHGTGGGGIVTKGAIWHQRMDAMIQDADCIWVGHTHDSWNMQIAIETLSTKFHPIQKEVQHIQTPSYKNDYEDGNNGWHIETGKPPKPLGGYWLKIEPYRDQTDGDDTIRLYATAVKTT